MEHVKGRKFMDKNEKEEESRRNTKSRDATQDNNLFGSNSDEAELLPVSKNKLLFFQSRSWHKLHKIGT